MSLDQEQLALQLHALVSYPNWLVAYSGGLDSTVLLCACRQYIAALSDRQVAQPGNPVPVLQAIHVDHQLSRHHAQWVEHCEHFCETLNVPLHVSMVDVVNTGKGVEQAARVARYRAIDEHLLQFDKPAVLLTAHHTDDQAETVLMRLFRGAGIRGVAAMEMPRIMDASNSVIARPLLGFCKQELQDYAMQQSLDWIEDESNSDQHLDRNHLRLNVMPAIVKRWPKAVAAIARFSRYAAESEKLNSDLAAIDLENVTSSEKKFERCLELSSLLELAAYRRKNLLRYWLWGHSYPSFDAQKLEALDEWLQRKPAEGRQSGEGFSFRIYRNRLYLVNEQWLESLAGFLAQGRTWQLPDSLTISGLGKFTVEQKSNGTGLASGEYHIGRRNRQQEVAVNGMHKSVHKIMQELGIPEWLRDAYPVIYKGEEVAAIGPIVADNYRDRNGYHIEWVFNEVSG